MTKTRNTVIFAVSFIVVASVYLFLFAIPATDRTIEKEKAIFSNANLNGVVEKVGTKHHTTSFKLKGVQQEFVIRDNIDEQLNENKTFGDVVSKGDRIIKPAKKDTLTVLHLGKAYKYTFR